MDILRQSVALTPEMQAAYYQDVIIPSYEEKHPKQILFSILFDGECIGYGGLVHINWKVKEAEVSFLLDSRRKEGTVTYSNDFKAFLWMIKKVAFDDLMLDVLVTETYDVRPDHIATLESQGFVEEERMEGKVLIKGVPVDSIIHKCRR